MTILIACGLAREARIVSAPGVVAIAGGGDADRLEAELERHAPQARAILSSGLCGALDPALEVGDLVIGGLAQALDAHPKRGSSFTPPLGRGEDLRVGSEADEKLLRRLRDLLPGASLGASAGVDGIIATAEEKAALRASSGAIAADMESHVAARVARRHGLPFAVVRAVSDDARHALPPAALVGMRPDGGVDLGAVLRSIAKSPAQVPALIATGIDAERAFRALLRGHRRLRTRAGDLDAHLLDMV